MTQKTKKPKPEINHTDVFGKPLQVGTAVAFANSNALAIGQIVKVNPKMLRVAAFTSSSYKPTYLKYPSDMIVVDGPAVTMYLLKKSA